MKAKCKSGFEMLKGRREKYVKTESEIGSLSSLGDSKAAKEPQKRGA